MSEILVATGLGCRIFTVSGEGKIELAGRPVFALAPEVDGACLAVVDKNEIWRRSAGGEWALVTKSDLDLGSIVAVDGRIFGGAMAEGVMVCVSAGGAAKRLAGFDNAPGRAKWFANGPPLHVRSLMATADGAAILAAVHVGGIPRSSDQGQSWTPTIPIEFDVHEVRGHPTLSNIAAAAAAVGLCVSRDGGRNWKVLSEGLELKDSLAVAVLQDEALFSIQDGPFAKRSQLWRWRIGSELLEQVRDGLPEWLDGKIDTGHIAASGGRAAVVDGGGNLWTSTTGSTGWKRLATDLQYAFGLVILPSS